MLSLLVENVKKLSGEGSIILSSKLNVQGKNNIKIIDLSIFINILFLFRTNLR